MGVSFIETSAKNSGNVEEAFRLMAIEIKNQMDPQPIQRNRFSGRIHLETREIKNEKENKCTYCST
jgi:hypothetical protein